MLLMWALDLKSYYVADAGFGLKGQFITPHKRVHYHLKEYSRNPPKNIWELFNFWHSSLRNAIERAFGVLKKRFHIVSSSNEPTYGVKMHKIIVLALCILHNYLIGADPNEQLLDQVDWEIFSRTPHNLRSDNENTTRGKQIRNSLAYLMWNDCCKHWVKSYLPFIFFQFIYRIQCLNME